MATMKQWYLYGAETLNQRVLTIVSAKDKDEAREKLDKRLTRPGLKRWHEKWVADGQIVIKRSM